MISVREKKDCPSSSIVFYADNYINDIEGEMLEKLCQEHFDKGIEHIIIDFSNTELVNSIGISILIGIVEKIKDRKNRLFFSGLGKVNQQIFNMCGLTKHVEVFDSEKDALEQINPG